MSALAEALVAAQRRAIAAIEKSYLDAEREPEYEPHAADASVNE